MEKKRVPTTIEGKELLADVDYTLAAESVPISAKDMAERLTVRTKSGKLRHIGTENFNPRMIPQEEQQQQPMLQQAIGSIEKAPIVEEVVEKNAYTPKQMERTLAKMMARLYGKDNLKTLQANPQEYKKFYWQHEYDLVKNNPNVFNHFKKYYPEKLNEIEENVIKNKVVLGNLEEYGFNNLEVLADEKSKEGMFGQAQKILDTKFLDITASPFDEESLIRAKEALGIRTLAQRQLYDIAIGIPSNIVDFTLSGKPKVVDFAQKYVQPFVKNPLWMARRFGVEDKFTEEEKKNITFDMVYAAIPDGEMGVTASDKFIAELSRGDGILARAAQSFFNLTPIDETILSPDREMATPGGVPLGATESTALNIAEIGANAMTLTGLARLGLEGGKFLARRGSKFTKNGVFDPNAALVALRNKQSGQGLLGKTWTGLRKGAITSSRDLKQTIAFEQALTLGSVVASSATQEMFKDSFANMDPLSSTGILGAVSILGPIVGIGLGSFIGKRAVMPVIGSALGTRATAKLFFDGQLDTAFDIIEKGQLGISRGDKDQIIKGKGGLASLAKDVEVTAEERNLLQGLIEDPKTSKVFREITRTLATVKQETPEVYDTLFKGYRAFKEQRESLRSSLLKDSTDPKLVKEVDGILADLTSATEANWSIGLFEGAKESYLQMGRVANRASLLTPNQSYKQVFENLNKIDYLQGQADTASRSYTTALFKLLDKVEGLEESGQGVSGPIRKMVNNMMEQHRKHLAVPQRMEANISRSLRDIYNISERANANEFKNIDNAFDAANNTIKNLDPEEQVYLSELIQERIADPKNNYGKFNKTLEKLDIIQNSIEEKRKAVANFTDSVKGTALISKEGIVAKRPKIENMKQRQINLFNDVFDRNKTRSNELYDEAFRGVARGQTIDTSSFVISMNNFIKNTGLEYGPGGIQKAKQIFTDLARNDPKVRPFINTVNKLIDIDQERSNLRDIVSPSAEQTARLNSLDESFDKIRDELKEPDNLSPKEAVAFRSSIGQKAFDAQNGGDRQGASILMQAESLLNDYLDVAIPEGSPVFDRLKTASDFYRDNVGQMFFSKSLKNSYKSDTDIPIPFNRYFNRTNQFHAGEGMDSATTTRDLYDRMIGDDAELKTKFDAEMKDVMLLQLYGNLTEQKMTERIMLDNISNTIDLDKSTLFYKDNGFRDILGLPEDFDDIIKRTPAVDNKGNFMGRSRKALEKDAATQLEGDPLYNAKDMEGNAEVIGSIAKEIGEKAIATAEENISIGMRLFADASKGKTRLYDIGENIVSRIFKEETGADSAKAFDILVKTVREQAPEQAQFFEDSIRRGITRRLLEKTVVRQADQDFVDMNALSNELGSYRELYKTVLGDEFDDAVSLVKLSNNSRKGEVVQFGQDLKPMSDSAALSRAFSVARGVVSVRYVASEYLLRMFSSKGNETIMNILATPGFAELAMEAVDTNRIRPFTARKNAVQTIIPALVGSAKEYTNRQEYENFKSSLYSLYQDSQMNNTDFLQNVMGLIVTAQNREATEKLLQSYAMDVQAVAQGISPSMAEKVSIGEQMRSLGLQQ